MKFASYVKSIVFSVLLTNGLQLSAGIPNIGEGPEYPVELEQVDQKNLLKVSMWDSMMCGAKVTSLQVEIEGRMVYKFEANEFGRGRPEIAGVPEELPAQAKSGIMHIVIETNHTDENGMPVVCAAALGWNQATIDLDSLNLYGTLELALEVNGTMLDTYLYVNGSEFELLPPVSIF